MYISASPFSLAENLVQKQPQCAAPLYDKMSSILEIHLSRDTANLVVEYTLNLEELVKNGFLERLKMLLLWGHFPSLKMPAIYCSMLAAIFGKDDVLHWLLESGYLKKEVTDLNANFSVMQMLYFQIVRCAYLAGHEHILAVLVNFPVVDIPDLESSEKVAFCLARQPPRDIELRSNLIEARSYKELAANLQKILNTSYGFDTVFGEDAYVTFSGCSVFLLEQEGFFDFINLLEKEKGVCEYYLHKRNLSKAIKFLDIPLKNKGQVRAENLHLYFDVCNLFILISKNVHLIKEREAIAKCLICPQANYFAKLAIANHEASDEEVFYALLKDYVNYRLIHPMGAIDIFNRI